MNKWDVKELKQFGRVVTGKTPPKNEKKYFDGEYLFVSPKDLELDKLYVFETETKITREALDKFKNQVIPKNSVMYTSLSFSFGKIGIASEAVLTNQQISSIVVNSKHDFRFVYYLLRANRSLIFSYNSGIDTPIVPESVFEKIEFRCPPLPIQKKIAAVLSTYDDLIENNDRRITLLEKMAEEIYREWFVRLRFPGYEQTTFHKGIPEGWKIVELNDVVFTKNGKSVDLDENGTYKVYGSNGIIGKAKKYNTDCSIIIGRVGAYCVSIQIEKEKSWATDNTIIATANLQKTNIYWCFFLLKFLNLGGFAGGSAQPLLTQGVIGKIEVLLSPSEVNSQFEKYVENIFNQIELLVSKNKNLKQTRDRLLTRLISGKLSVEDLDIQFPPSMIESTKTNQP